MTSSRAELIADASLSLLVERGMRGLTHRAVDEAAGLPPGSTSNLARTRAALLELTLVRLTELERGRLRGVGVPEGEPFPGAEVGPPREWLAEVVARVLHGQLTVDRRWTLARFELALEATRRPELRVIYDRSGRGFREMVVELMVAAGSADPVRHARVLLSFAEGVLFHALAGAGEEPGLEELRTWAGEVLEGLLA
ncbi:TetR/AcrR family transcriptional regulator [Actinomadura viridis]|uniref:DNA-binding transcriptional regulator YbjK n=1 Tax=Actinomadura viridis TaxID=58110 RepID=A0A931DI41_9ACTN|nr:TetR family transcriptional regulator C-terminal domain-containing protein [Actinomadura viridis]MBG6089752.1 DNA-binding transcriptional regulator YbjK [Actinomadura viridis]